MTKWKVVPIKFTEDELKAIENYRIKHKLQSNSKVIREAIEELIGIYEPIRFPEAVSGATWFSDHYQELIEDPHEKEKFEKTSLNLFSKLMSQEYPPPGVNFEESADNYEAFQRHKKVGRPKIRRTRGRPKNIGLSNN